MNTKPHIVDVALVETAAVDTERADCGRLRAWARAQGTRRSLKDLAQRAIGLLDRFDRHREVHDDFAQLLRDTHAGWVPHDAVLREHRLRFACNVCGAGNASPIGQLDRETRSCLRCGSNVRVRSIVDLLSRALFDTTLALPQFPDSRNTGGVGLSDASFLARRLARKFGYVNTFYHRAPRLDVCAPAPALIGSCDFVIASDVLEHVVPPVARAFNGIHALLRPGGVFVGSVPYSLDDAATIEHFPELHDFRLSGPPDARRLHNRRRDGREETFDNLVFHGGKGATLEMRQFSRRSLTAELLAAGFSHVEYCVHDNYRWGIVWLDPWSTPFVAFK